MISFPAPIRRAALADNSPCTLAAAKATLHAIRTLKEGKLKVKSLQEYHEMVGKKMINEREASAVKETINAILSSLRYVGTISAGLLAILLAFSRQIPKEGFVGKVIDMGGACFFTALAMSLVTHLLFAISHVWVADPGKSFVSDNRASFAFLIITYLLFAAGFLCLLLAFSFLGEASNPSLHAIK